MAFKCAVFSVADIDPSKLTLLIELSETYTRQLQDVELALAFIDSKDLSTISGCRGSPEFRTTTTPFLEHTVQEVRDWFDVHIVLPQREDFMHSCFLVLDKQTNNHDSCLFVWMSEEAHKEKVQTHGDPLCGTPDSPFLSLRSHFDMAIEAAALCESGKDIEYGIMGSFRRSGMVMDKYGMQLAMFEQMFFSGVEFPTENSVSNFLKW